MPVFSPLDSSEALEESTKVCKCQQIPVQARGSFCGMKQNICANLWITTLDLTDSVVSLHSFTFWPHASAVLKSTQKNRGQEQEIPKFLFCVVLCFPLFKFFPVVILPIS